MRWRGIAACGMLAFGRRSRGAGSAGSGRGGEPIEHIRCNGAWSREPCR